MKSLVSTLLLVVGSVVITVSCSSELRKLKMQEIRPYFQDQGEPDHDSIVFYDTSMQIISHAEVVSFYQDNDRYAFDYYVNADNVLKKVMIRKATQEDMDFRQSWTESFVNVQFEYKYQELNCDYLASDLTDIHEADQAYRKTNGENRDHENLNYVINALEQCVDTVHFANVVSQDMSTIWLVLQHSNLEYRERFYPLLQRAVDKELLEPSMMAMMLDRIRIDRGECQLFGTQVGAVDDGPLTLSPVCDPHGLKGRRDSVGLGDINEYLSRWNLTFDPNDHTFN